MHRHLSLTSPTCFLFQVVQLVRALATADVQLSHAIVVMTEAAGSRGHSCLQSCRWRLRVVLTPLALQASSCKLRSPVCTPRRCGCRPPAAATALPHQFGGLPQALWAPVGKLLLPTTPELPVAYKKAEFYQWCSYIPPRFCPSVTKTSYHPIRFHFAQFNNFRTFSVQPAPLTKQLCSLDSSRALLCAGMFISFWALTEARTFDGVRFTTIPSLRTAQFYVTTLYQEHHASIGLKFACDRVSRVRRVARRV